MLHDCASLRCSRLTGHRSACRNVKQHRNRPGCQLKLSMLSCSPTSPALFEGSNREGSGHAPGPPPPSVPQKESNPAPLCRMPLDKSRIQAGHRMANQDGPLFGLVLVQGFGNDGANEKESSWFGGQRLRKRMHGNTF